MTSPTQLQVTYLGAYPRRDRSFQLKFDTLELTDEQMAGLHKLQLTECWLTVSADKDAAVEAPAYQKTNPARPKSPSQALRQELWSYFQAAGLEGEFDSFYEKVTDQYVRYWHDKRMTRDRRQSRPRANQRRVGASPL